MPAFTHVWDDTKPLDTQLADLLGQDIRDLKLDIQERMAKIFTDFTLDPLVYGDTIAGIRTGDQWVVPACSFLSDLHAKENDLGDGVITGFVGQPLLNAPLPSFLRGCTITKLEYLVDNTGITSIDCDLMERGFADTPPAASSINNVHVTVAGAHIVASDALALLINAANQYYFRMTGTGGADASFLVYAVRITFNRQAVP